MPPPEAKTRRAPSPPRAYQIFAIAGSIASFAVTWAVSDSVWIALGVGLACAMLLVMVGDALALMRAPPDEPPRRPG